MPSETVILQISYLGTVLNPSHVVSFTMIWFIDGVLGIGEIDFFLTQNV